MKSFRIALIALAGFAVTESQAGTNLFRAARVYVEGQSFTWEEFNDGNRLLEETGELFGVGGEMELNLNRKLILILQGEFFGGDVDYDGNVQNEDGTLTPAKTKTTYYGASLAAKITTPVALGKSVELKPHAGLGLRAWERTLDSSFDDRYIGDNGYIEDWATFHALLGATISFPISGKLSGFVSAELRLPLATYEVVDLSNVGGDDDVELEPEAKVSVFAEAGLAYKMFFASVFVETLDFDESDLDDSGQYLQPESEAQIVGLRLGVRY